MPLVAAKAQCTEFPCTTQVDGSEWKFFRAGKDKMYALPQKFPTGAWAYAPQVHFSRQPKTGPYFALLKYSSANAKNTLSAGGYELPVGEAFLDITTASPTKPPCPNTATCSQAVRFYKNAVLNADYAICYEPGYRDLGGALQTTTISPTIAKEVYEQQKARLPKGGIIWGMSIAESLGYSGDMRGHAEVHVTPDLITGAEHNFMQPGSWQTTTGQGGVSCANVYAVTRIEGVTDALFALYANKDKQEVQTANTIRDMTTPVKR